MIEDYVFSTIVNVLITAVLIVTLRVFQVIKSPWLIIVMVFLCLRVCVPGTTLFKCPHCGHIEEAKVFKIAIYQDVPRGTGVEDSKNN